MNDKFVAASAIAVAVTLATIFWLRPLARRIGLVDTPDGRKRHRGRVPVIGGLCFFAGTIAGLAYFGYVGPFVAGLLVGGMVIVLLGVLDDLYDLRPGTRLLIQAAAVVLVMAATGVYVHSAGEFFVGGEVRLFWLGIPFTVVAVVGLVNAFNMLDGIDGLAGSLAMVSIAAIFAFSGGQWPMPSVLLVLLILGAALVPYLLVNLGWPDGRRIFMGDAGSMLIGFVLAWSLVYLSQRGDILAPVDVLWCVALPVLDTLAVMYQRMRKGMSPFKADRRHLHHMLLDAGLPPRRTLALLVVSGAALAALGYVMRDVPEGLSLAAFLGILGAYVLYAPKAAAWLREARQGESTALPGRQSGVVAGLLGRSWLYMLLGKQSEAPPWTHAQRRSEPTAGRGSPSDASPTPSTPTPSTAIPGDDTRSPRSDADDGRVKALCVLDGTPEDMEMVPIVQQLSADARFHARICIAGPQAGESRPGQQFAGHANAGYANAGHANERADVERAREEHVGAESTAHAWDAVEIVSCAFDEMKRMVRTFDPDVVLIRGESPAVLAAALVAYYQEVPVARMEVGVPLEADASRVHDEANDRIISSLVSLHFTSTERASEELVAAGIPRDRITVTNHARIGSHRGRSRPRSADACARIAEALANLPEGTRAGGVTVTQPIKRQDVRMRRAPSTERAEHGA